MTRFGYVTSWACVVVVLLATGCQQQRINMKRLRQRADRPPELAQLDVLVGRWSSDTKSTLGISDEVVTDTGTASFTWDANGWVLIERFEHDEGGQRVAGTAVWSWDPDDNWYRITWFYDSGARADGEASYTEIDTAFFQTAQGITPDTDVETPGAVGIWFFAAEMDNPYTDIRTRRSGQMVLVDENKLQQWWTEWLPGPLGSASRIMNFERVCLREQPDTLRN